VNDVRGTTSCTLSVSFRFKRVECTLVIYVVALPQSQPRSAFLFSRTQPHKHEIDNKSIETVMNESGKEGRR